MKRIATLLLLQVALIGCVFYSTSQSELKPIISKIDMSGSKSSIMALDKKIDAIVKKYPDKWLPLYWSGFTKLLISHKCTTLTEKDAWIAKADGQINLAWNKTNKKSELAVLKGLSVSSKIMANSKKRGPKLVSKLAHWVAQAKVFDPTNPRAYYLDAMTVMATPKGFGGGPKRAVPLFETALVMYKNFKPASSIHPNWGKDQVQKELAKIKAGNL